MSEIYDKKKKAESCVFNKIPDNPFLDDTIRNILHKCSKASTE